jgi:hypothetical protein
MEDEAYRNLEPRIKNVLEEVERIKKGRYLTRETIMEEMTFPK